MNTVTTCIGCGCNDLDACVDGCYWITGIVENVSVCSNCHEHLDRFLAGDLEICPQFREECPVETPTGIIMPDDPRFDATLRAVLRG